jgi:CarboxypepD_reg-like domain/TonB dependent receptor/TonB-dependent Receptor Plug Domain
MMKKKILFCLLLYSGVVCAQNKFSITGYVKDSLSSENLIGATVSFNGQQKGVVTNGYGFFSITLPEGHYVIIASYVGYVSKNVEINLDKNINFNFLINLRSATNEEVVVYAKKKDVNVTSAQMGKIDLSMSQIKNLPVLFGEIDIMKTLQLLPGVSNAGEGNTGLYVRGGGPDQNLITLDDAIVYNTGHLFGFFSIFNSDAIKNTTLIKGSMPAQYGGRLSSVLDISMKEGNMNKYEVDGGLGLLASRLSIQGPLIKQKASFIVSYRRTYVDLLVSPFVPRSSSFYGSGYYFYDLNVKMNYQFSEKDRIYLSGYFGRDVFDFNNSRRSFSTDIPWGNSTATLRWNHVFNRRLFANTTLLYNDYKFAFNGAQDNFALSLSSGIHDLSAKTDFDYYMNPKNQVRFGALYTFHTFTPNILNGHQDSIVFTPNNSNIKYAREAAVYLQDDWQAGKKIDISLGLRWSVFEQTGPFTIYKTDADGNKTDSTHFGKGQNVKTYGGPEPRFTIRYSLNEQTSVKGSVSRNLQYIHLVSNAGTTLPTDLWVPSTYIVAPQISWLYSAGLFKNFNSNMFESSVELYYKQMQNQIEYKEGYTPSLSDPENSFVFGKGWSYGAEFFVNKQKGRWTGWIGYTLSWTWRQFPALNNGQKYPAKYDRRNDISVVSTYELNKHWKLSAVFVFASGNATSYPEKFYIVEGTLTQDFSRINQYRLPPYNRLDLAAIYTPTHKINKKLHSSWVFSIYNVYNRLNPYFIYFDQTGNPYDGTLQVQAKKVSLFPILPSVTWNFHF